MELVKFVKVTEENRDEVAQSFGCKDEGSLLKDAEFDTMVGLWVDADEDVEILDSVTGILTSVKAVLVENRCLGGGRWISSFSAVEVDLLVIDPGVGVMSIEQYERVFC